MAYVYNDSVRTDVLAMIPPEGRVIGSIGCGYATTEAELVRAGREVHGVDVSAEAIEVARGRLTSARVVGPDEWRAFEPGSLDGLILADVLEHIPRAWEALRAFAEAVRPGGWVAISVPNMLNMDALWQVAVRGDWPERDQGIFDGTHVQFMSDKRLERWCRGAGLVVERRFPKYDMFRPRKTRLYRLVDRLTFGAFHDRFQYQLLFLCRRTGAGA